MRKHHYPECPARMGAMICICEAVEKGRKKIEGERVFYVERR